MALRIRTMLSIRKRPTPTDTTMISTEDWMPGTLPASTCRSGSATVMAMPRRKLTERISFRLRDRVSCAPMWEPICVMDSSEPTVKSPMPRIRKRAPITKASIRSVSIGTQIRQSTATMVMMGSTEAQASFIFSRMTIRLFNGEDSLLRRPPGISYRLMS